MLALGIAVEMKKPKRPTAYTVLLDDASGINLDDLGSLASITHTLTSTDEDYPSILAQLSVDIRAWLRDRAVDVATVRRADKPLRAMNTDGPRYHLLADGALTSAIREMVVPTFLRTGREVAQAWKLSKEEMDALGEEVVGAPAFAAAAAAALSCLPRP